MESWRSVWRDGFAPILPTLGLERLLEALRSDSTQLTQGSTTTPPPLQCVEDWPCEGADAIGYCGWKGEDLGTVGEVEEFFARKCFECDQRLGEPAACRWFLNWFDDTPRNEMRRELVGEIERELWRRHSEADRELILPAGMMHTLVNSPEDALIHGAVGDWLQERGYGGLAAGYYTRMNEILNAVGGTK